MRPSTALLLVVAMLAGCADNGKEESTANASPPATNAARFSPESGEGEHSAKAVAPSRIETIQFPAEDGLLVTADLYQWHDEDAPFIVLFHQAGWSRGEYKEIAPKLGELGYNCMAVDQRSGKSVNQVDNETARLAAREKVSAGFIDALKDMRAALRLVETRYPDAKRIAWGSSYSSALVLVLAGEEPDLMDAVISFSPGEYFARFGKSKHYVKDAAAKIEAPVFITSAKNEHKSWKAIYEAIPSDHKMSFLPETKGNHGSRSLWAKFGDSGAYWKAVEQFLRGL
jgi:alpha-beta hydrolase superfamily lysophospholipase